MLDEAVRRQALKLDPQVWCVAVMKTGECLEPARGIHRIVSVIDRVMVHVVRRAEVRVRTCIDSSAGRADAEPAGWQRFFVF